MVIKISKEIYMLFDLEIENKLIGSFYSFEEMLDCAIEFLNTDSVDIDYQNKKIYDSYSYRTLTYQQFKIEMRLP